MLDTDAIRTELEDERANLTRRLQELGVDPGGGSLHLGTDEGFADAAAITAEKGELLTLAGKLHESLTDVNDALTKLDNGTFGICEGCGGRIADERLEVLPSARLCLNCATS